MPPALKPAVPSQRLLRFLRAQTEGLAFAECTARLPPRRNVCTCNKTTRSPERAPSTPVARREPTMQAAFLNLDSILPKAFTKQRTAATPKTLDLTTTGGASRYASSGQSPREDCDRMTWQELIFGPNKKEREPLKEGDLGLDEEPGSIFHRRSLAAKAALDPRLRCTEVDGDGKVIMVDGELKKSELIAKVRDAGVVGNNNRMLLTSASDSMAFFHEISARSTRPTSRISSSARRLFYSTCCT